MSLRVDGHKVVQVESQREKLVAYLDSFQLIFHQPLRRLLQEASTPYSRSLLSFV